MKRIFYYFILLSILLICSSCSKNISLCDVIGHYYESTKISPSCDEDGYTLYQCVDCNHSYKDNIIKAYGHNLEYVEYLEPTCTENGKIILASCLKCEKIFENEIIPLLGHEYIIENGINATCTEDGLTEGKYCIRCDYKIEQEVISALGHSYEEVVIEPTCLDEGYSIYKCHCGETYSDLYVDALGHDMVIDERVEPTCIKEGLTEGFHCSRCEYKVMQQIIPSNGHIEIISKVGYSATNTKEGLSDEKQCTVCKEITCPQTIIDAKGFAWMLEDKELKLLMCGNSFTEDASNLTQADGTSQLFSIIQAMVGVDIKVTIGTITSGGKGLNWHASQAKEKNNCYYLNVISTDNPKWTRIKEINFIDAISWTNWDMISIQPYDLNVDTGLESNAYSDQVHDEFLYIEDSTAYLLDLINNYAPQAEAYCYMHWARTNKNTIYINASLNKYNSLAVYYRSMVDYLSLTGKRYSGIIPVALAVQNARTTYLAELSYNISSDKINYETDPQMGLQRDGGHLSFNIGRYIAALTFAEYLIPSELRIENYSIPSIRETESVGILPEEYTIISQKAVYEAVKTWNNNDYKVTDLSEYVINPIENLKEEIKDVTITIESCLEEAFDSYIENFIINSIPSDFAVSNIIRNNDDTVTLTLQYGYIFDDIIIKYDIKHNYIGTNCTICSEVHPAVVNYQGKVISILGDSISTFKGYIPVADGFNLEHRTRYPQDNLLSNVDDTWWMQIINSLDAKLGINDSWASTEVYNYIDEEVNSSSDGTKACMASMTRIQNLGSNGTPDTILFFGGTNDITQKRPLGEFNTANVPVDVDLLSVKWETVVDAYVTAIMRMKYFYPDSEIIAILPYYRSNIDKNSVNMFNEQFIKICTYFEIDIVDLRTCGISYSNIPDSTHPDAVGMKFISNAVLETLLKDTDLELGEHVVCKIEHQLSNAQSSLSYYKGISYGNSFKTILEGNNLSVMVLMNNEDITDNSYNSTINEIFIDKVIGDVKIIAVGEEKPIYEDYLQQLPDDICCETNLWSILNHDYIYYTASGWGQNASKSVYSITIPVTYGDKLWATSFQKNGINGNTVSSSNGIRVTYFDENGVLKELSTSDTYKEFTNNGYLTVPSGAIAVNIPLWNNNDDNEVYILNKEHEFKNGICTICEIHALDLGYQKAEKDNEGVVNTINRAYSLTDVEWTPLLDVPGVKKINGEFTVVPFKAGVTYKGIPYSGVTKNDCYVGLNVSLETFITALNNKNSVLYTENLHSSNPKSATFYGTVCSKFVQYALNIPGSYNTNNIPNIPGMKTIAMPGKYTIDQIKLGDVIVDVINHTTICTDILYDENGNVAFIEISEAVLPLCRRMYWSVEEFYEHFKDYRLCRYSNIDNVPSIKSLSNDSEYALMPRYGNKFNYSVSSSKAIVDILDNSYIKAIIIRDGVIVEEINITGLNTFKFDRSIPGKIEMYLEKENGIRSESVFAYVVQSNANVLDSTYFTSGKLTVNIDGSSGNPLYVQVGSAHAIFCEIDNDGVVSIEFPFEKVSSKQIRVAYQNEYGIYLSNWTTFTTEINPSDDSYLSLGQYWDGYTLTPSSSIPVVQSGKTNYWTYTMIPVEANTIYYSYGCNRMWYFDENQKIISTYNANTESEIRYQFTTPSNAAYLSITYSPFGVKKGTETILKCHDFESYIINPTCKEEGYTEYICKNCGYSYCDNYVCTIEHEFINAYCIYCNEEELYEILYLHYDDHLNIIDKSVDLVDDNTTILSIENDYLVASDVGEVKVYIDEELFLIVVNKAKINIITIMGQSNAGNHFANSTSDIKCPIGTAYWWGDGKGVNAIQPVDYINPSMGFHVPLLAELYAQSVAAGNPVKNVLVWQEGITSKNGKPLTSWVSSVENTTGTDETVKMIENCVKYYKDNSKFYEIVGNGVYWIQGESDVKTDPVKYEELFMAMWYRLKTAGAEYVAFFRVRKGVSYNEVGMAHQDLDYHGSLNAQLNMIKNNLDMFLATSITENWVGEASATHSVDISSYITMMETYGSLTEFSDEYGNTATIKDGIITTTMKELYGSNNRCHYGKFGAAIIGCDAAKNMYEALHNNKYEFVMGDTTGSIDNQTIYQHGFQVELNIHELKNNIVFRANASSMPGTLDIEVYSDENDITEFVISTELNYYGSIDVNTLANYENIKIIVTYHPVNGIDGNIEIIIK